MKLYKDITFSFCVNSSFPLNLTGCCQRNTNGLEACVTFPTTNNIDYTARD